MRLDPRTGAVMLAGALAVTAPAPSAQAQNLDALAPLIGELVAPRERLSDREIRNRSLEAGAGAFLSSPEASPQAAFRSYQAYQNERRRLEEQERQRRQRQVEAAVGLFGAILQQR